MKKTTISQTSIKILNRNHCPHYLNEVYLERNIESIPSEAMNKGVYAETLAIGSGAYDKVLYDLPRLKSGDKSTDQKRIDSQVELFRKTLLDQYKMNTENVQVGIEHDFDDEITVSGNLDMVTPIEDDLLGYQPIAIVDFKLTKSIYNQHGDFCWAFPANMDHLQATTYTWLFEKKFGKRINFYYFVMDYKPEPEFKVIRKKVGNFELSEFKEQVRIAKEHLSDYQENGYNRIANEKDCRMCPMKKDCPKFSVKKEIEII